MIIWSLALNVDESGEYLVVPASSIDESGNECDKAGVGFAAFARQPDRCGRVRGTCLKNQPLAYRRHDAVRMTGAINETTLEMACPRAIRSHHVGLRASANARRFKCGPARRVT